MHVNELPKMQKSILKTSNHFSLLKDNDYYHTLSLLEFYCALFRAFVINIAKWCLFSAESDRKTVKLSF